ncbi:7113_t:CDS:1, partial [Cetraspora pellucida]
RATSRIHFNKAYTWLCQIKRPLLIHYSTIIKHYANSVPVYPTE